MTTALAIRPNTAPAIQQQGEPSFPDLVSMGQQLVGTGFLPEHIKNGAQAAAIILAGRELGMPPMRALRSLVLVKGKVTEYADSQLSRFKSDGGKAVFVELTDTSAVLKLRHPNGDEHTETFTSEDARRAGLTSSAMYSKFPKAMFRSRVITAGLKSVGWEGGAGVYDPTELSVESASDTEIARSAMPTHMQAAEDTSGGGNDALARAIAVKVNGKTLAELTDSELVTARAHYVAKNKPAFVEAIDLVIDARVDDQGDVEDDADGAE